MDTGTAYGLPEPSYDADLVRVGPRTPGGEMLRRYWHPIALSVEAGSVPRKLRVLGEDLILFRDGRGRPGLVYPRCCHRGTTLYYGKVERDGSTCVVNINQQHPERRRDEKSPSKPSIHRLSEENADKEDDQAQQAPGDR